MTKRMLVDATHPEETRVAIVDSYRDINRLDDLDFGLASKPILRGNIYLAKVMRVEPSLQAAFVEYGGNRHGFLPFSEIHPDYFRIPIADRSQEEENGVSPETGTTDLDHTHTEDVESDETNVSETDIEDVEEEHEVALPTNMAPATPLIEEPLTEQLAPTNEFSHSGDNDVGLITDFGNAVVNQDLMVEAPQPEPAPVESIGGEVAERFVRARRPHYKIQEVLKRGQVMLIQVVKEERGNKGAALTTFLSLAGRYCVLMPNTDHGGGVSRKITNHQDRRRMKEILDQLEIPEGMAVILRTAGMEQDPPDIQRDMEYLLRLWDSIREQTLQSTAPSLIYEEANLIKRSVRDLFSQDISEILVAGEEGYNRAREFMRTIMPDQIEKIRHYNDPIPLFFRYQVESQIDSLHSPTVQLRSGGYIVINPTEALVSIDVNSGRATRERHIEETALKTNIEAADEIARQLRLRDLAGLVVIDFIDMEDGRNNSAVERRVKEAMKNDRARLQIGHISAFGLLELSRQRLRPSLLEINFEKCPHCSGVGFVRSIDSAALSILRAIEEEGIRQNSTDLVLHVSTKIALYILNQKRKTLSGLEQKYDLHVLLHSDDTLVPPEYRIERSRNRDSERQSGPAVNSDKILADAERELPPMPQRNDVEPDQETTPNNDQPNEAGNTRRRFRQGGRNGRNPFRRDNQKNRPPFNQPQSDEGQPALQEAQDINRTDIGVEGTAPNPQNETEQQRRRRRGRRGGKRRNGNGEIRTGQEPREGGRRWGNNNQQNSAAMAQSAVNIPANIHDIDTTPRPFQRTSGSNEQSRNTYETFNQPSEKPKVGWWKKLTGQ